LTKSLSAGPLAFAGAQEQFLRSAKLPSKYVESGWATAPVELKSGQGEPTMGYLLVTAAGILQGAFVLPMKWTTRWAWENTWLIYSTAAYLIWPWQLVFMTIPHPLKVLASTSLRSLALVELYGLGWGIGAIAFGLGVARLGMALGFTIIIGLAATAGALIPMIVLAPRNLSQPQGIVMLVALALVLIGLGLGSWGGKLREFEQDSTSGTRQSTFAVGLAICIASGLLSSCGNLAFTFGAEFARRTIDQGAPESMAGNFLLAPLTLPIFLCNAVYCVSLIRANKTAGLFLAKGTRHYWGLAALMGFMWLVGFALYAPGTRRLGTLGTSVGWAVMMSTMVITANILGCVTGEWKGANRKAYILAVTGVVVQMVAIAVVGYSNQL
jgi:L-rhamnose-H+ transport protein